MKKFTRNPHIPQENTSCPDVSQPGTTLPLFGDFRLRLVSEADVHAIFHTIDTQRNHLGRWLPFVAQTLREEQTGEAVRRMVSDQALNPVFTIRDDTNFAGLIGYKSTDLATRTTEIGYWLSEAFQGRGLMTRAVEALCREAFDRRGIDRVEIRCALRNLPSNRIPQRLGFRLDRVEVRGEMLSDGTCTDLNVYVLERPQR